MTKRTAGKELGPPVVKRKRVQGERVVTTWEYTNRERAKLSVPVVMVDEHFDRDGNRRLASFRVRLPDMDILEEHTDINELKKKAWKRIDEKLAATWEDFIYVTVSGKAKHDHGRHVTDEFERWWGSANIDVEVYRIRLGVIGGKKVHQKLNQVTHHMGGTGVWDGWPSVGVGADAEDYNRVSTRALIRDTPENVAALAKVIDTIGSLRGMLEKLLAPDELEATLARILAGGSPLALPEPASAPAQPAQTVVVTPVPLPPTVAYAQAWEVRDRWSGPEHGGFTVYPTLDDHTKHMAAIQAERTAVLAASHGSVPDCYTIPDGTVRTIMVSGTYMAKLEAQPPGSTGYRLTREFSEATLHGLATWQASVGKDCAE